MTCKLILHPAASRPLHAVFAGALGLALCGSADAINWSRYDVRELPIDPEFQVTVVGLDNVGTVVGNAGVGGWQPSGVNLFIGQPSGPLEFPNELGFDALRATAMNDSGGLAGIAYRQSGGEWHPTLFRRMSDGTTVEIGHLDGPGAYATAINERGDVVGYGITVVPPMFLSKAVFYSSATGLLNLGTLGGYQSVAHDVNNNGLVVGGADQLPFGQRAFAWRGGQMTNLGMLAGDSYSYAALVNDADQVFGQSIANTGATRWFIWTASEGMREFAPRAGALVTELFKRNGRGDLAGRYRDVDGSSVLFRYTAEEGFVDVVNIGDLYIGTIVDVNTQGHAVTHKSQDTYEFFPNYFSPTDGLQRLDQIEFGLDWTVEEVVSINEAGQIVAAGSLNGRQRAAVFSPPAACTGDLDDDGAVGLTDLAMLLAAFGCEADHGCGGNLDGDRDTDLTDLAILLARFGSSCD